MDGGGADWCTHVYSVSDLHHLDGVFRSAREGIDEDARYGDLLIIRDRRAARHGASPERKGYIKLLHRTQRALS